MFVFRNSNNPVEEAGALLNFCLTENKDRPLLFLSSGGSSLSLLRHVREECLGSHVTVSVLDERFSVDRTVNNFAQLASLQFYTRARRAGCQFIDTRVHDRESCEALALRFDQGLQKWRKQYPDGIAVATLGIAENGHIAGIMPMPNEIAYFKQLFEMERFAVGYHVESFVDRFTERVTSTLTFLREQIDSAIGFAIDEQKRDVLDKVLRKEGNIQELPALVVHEMKEVIFVSNVFSD